MNVYVESNFVLELAFAQEPCESCQEILSHGESGNIHLMLPGYCLAEPLEKLKRQARSRLELQRHLDGEIRQLLRTSSYRTRIIGIQDIANLLVQSSEEEKKRFADYRNRLLGAIDIIPLTNDILKAASNYEESLDLAPQDALVYASVITHMRQSQPAKACFLNKNSKDFDSPDIIAELKQFNCRLISSFDDGLGFIRVNLPS